VGEDQLPHLELSREIVRRFNRHYGNVLVEPQALLSEAALIPGIDGRKMSKSLGNDIGVREDPDTMRRKVLDMVTDPQKIRLGDRGRPEICPVFALHREFSPDILEQTEAGCRAGTLGCVKCKQNLADRMIDYFAPYRERRGQLEESPDVVDQVLAEGATKVRPVVEDTMKAVRAAMSLG
jgi:tryptophanyl-tRNA synthetase